MLYIHFGNKWKRRSDVLKILKWCFILFIISFSEARSADVVERIVAVVNNDIILLNDLEQYTKQFIDKIITSDYSPEEEQAMIKKVRQKTLNTLIDVKLTDQQIKKLKITVSEEEVDKTINKIVKSKNSNVQDLKKALEAQNILWDEYRTRFRDQLLRRKLINKEVNSKYVLTTEDKKKYYEDHKEKFAGEKKYHLRIIAMKASSYDDEERKAILIKMNEILDDLKQGKTFNTLAMLYSDSKTAMDGGDLGFINYQDLSARLKETLKDKKAGECSPVLDTEFGFQIFYIEEIVETKPKTLDEATPEIEAMLFTEFVDKQYKAWLGNLKKRSHIKIYENL